MVTYIIMFIVAIFHLTMDMWLPLSSVDMTNSVIVGNMWLVGALVVLSVHNE